MSATHAAVWIDHHEAHIFHVEPSTFSESTVAVPHHVARHPKSQAGDTNHPDDQPRFFRDVVHSLAGAKEILVVGPSTAKVHFADYVREHEKSLQIVGVETVDHPTAKQMAAHVRRYFAAPQPLHPDR